MFVTGPDVVKTVTNETVTAEELGGASVHAIRSSVADGAYDNDVEALLQMRRLIDFLPANNRRRRARPAELRRCGASAEACSTAACRTTRIKPYDMKELF